MLPKYCVCLLIRMLDLSLRLFECIVVIMRDTIQRFTIRDILAASISNTAIVLFLFVLASYMAWNHFRGLARGRSMNMVEVNDWHTVVK